MSTDRPSLPDQREWARFGISDAAELHAGKQSRVFRAELDGVDVAIELTDGRLADRSLLQTRMALVEALAVDVDAVVRPHRIGRALVQPIGGWLMTATPFMTGDAVDLAQPRTNELLGRTLAQVHGSMALMPAQSLPPSPRSATARWKSIEARISTLGRWLDDLTTAPIGIRTSSAAWQEVLRTFVRSRQRRWD